MGLHIEFASVAPSLLVLSTEERETVLRNEEIHGIVALALGSSFLACVRQALQALATSKR